jgi:hypothetical protein
MQQRSRRAMWDEPSSTTPGVPIPLGHPVSRPHGGRWGASQHSARASWHRNGSRGPISSSPAVADAIRLALPLFRTPPRATLENGGRGADFLLAHGRRLDSPCLRFAALLRRRLRRERPPGLISSSPTVVTRFALSTSVHGSDRRSNAYGAHGEPALAATEETRHAHSCHWTR